MKLFRTLLMCLLVLAVPAQGFAAVTMAFCGPNHHGSGQTPRAEQVLHVEHGTGQLADGKLGERAEHHHAPAGHDETSAALDHSVPHAKFAQADKHKCSACASCCSAAAILGSMPVVPAPAATLTVFASVVPSVSVLAADGPDRPPRPVLA